MEQTMQSEREDTFTVKGAAPGASCIACSRRQFVSGSLLLAVGTVLAACGNGVIGSGMSDAITGPVNVTVNLSEYSALDTVGAIVKLKGTSTPIAVVRSATDTYLAFSMICTHQGSTINIVGNGFKCPNHGSQFDATGQWIPSRQRTTNLHQFAVTLDAIAGTLTLM
jgi:Rieske Fe-S protein